jgi:glycosyltransferase involved in cell wall biosynthesis
VVTRAGDFHAPEVEYLEHGVNGLVVPGDFESYVHAVSDMLSSPELRARLTAGAIRSAEDLDLRSMAAAFDAGVMRALGR